MPIQAHSFQPETMADMTAGADRSRGQTGRRRSVPIGVMETHGRICPPDGPLHCTQLLSPDQEICSELANQLDSAAVLLGITGVLWRFRR